MKERLHWIDWAKAICITLVAVGHTWLPESVRLVIYSFHMPAFFILSGYLFKANSVQKSMRSILFPVATAYVVNFIIHLIIKDATLEQLFFTPGTLFPYKWPHRGAFFGGMWFVHAYIMCRLLLGDMGLAVIRKYYKHIALLCVVLSCVFQWCNISSDLFVFRTFSCFPFMAWGLFLKESGWKPRIDKAYLIAILATVYVLLTYFNGMCDMYFMQFGYSYLLYFLNAVAGCFLLFHLCTYFRQNRLVEIISLGTLFTMGVHKTMFQIFMENVPGKLYSVAWIIVSMEMMVVCTCIVYLLLRFCPVALGRKKQ